MGFLNKLKHHVKKLIGKHEEIIEETTKVVDTAKKVKKTAKKPKGLIKKKTKKKGSKWKLIQNSTKL